MTRSPDHPECGARAIPHEERLLSLIAVNILDMVVFVDLEGWIQWVNEAVVQQFGYTRDELIGAHVYTLQAPGKNPPGFWSPGGTGRLLEKWEGVLVDRRKDGSEFAARVESFLVRDEHGSVTGIASISRDISEMVRAEEALRDSEERHRTILRTAMEGFWRVDMQGRLLEVNETYCRMSGYRAQELMTMRILDLEAVETDGDIAAHLQKIMARGEDRFESRHRRKDGTIFDVEISVQYRLIGGGWFVAFLRDITERKRAEKVLRESEEKYRILFESSRDALMTLEPPSWVFASCNQSTVDMFRAKSVGEFVSYVPWELSPERQPDGRASAEKAGEMIEKAMREGSHFFEWRHKRIGGEEFPATILLTRVEHAGKRFLQATVRDMSELKDYQRAIEERNRELEIISSAALTREFRIKELRDEIRALTRKLAGWGEET